MTPSQATPGPRAADLDPSGNPGEEHSDGRATELLEGLLVRLGVPEPRVSVLAQFVKFGVVGVSNTIIAFAIYTILLKVFGVWYIAASGIGFAIGAVNGFLLNRRWTFREHVGDALTPVRWFVVQGVGLLVNLGLVYLFVDGADLDKLVGQAIATIIVVVLTFFANRAWTFRAHTPVSPAGERVEPVA